MNTIVKGKELAADILQDLQARVRELAAARRKVTLAVIIVGKDRPSLIYIDRKQEAAEQVGIEFLKLAYPEDISKEELIKEIKKIQRQRRLSGMIIQLPVPESLWPHTREIANHIDIDIDVDCLSHLALGRVMMNESPLIPPTPGAIMHIIKEYKIDLHGKEVCLVGRGDLIGKPLAAMLAHQPVTLTVLSKATPDLSRYTRTADIIVTGVGKPGLITAKMVKDQCVVIDAGISFSRGQMHGDVDFESVKNKASLITPVPGGVGPITVAKLLANTVQVAESRG